MAQFFILAQSRYLMPRRPPQHPPLRYKERRRPIGTWLLREERDQLRALADTHGVSLAVYLQAVVVDVIAEITVRGYKAKAAQMAVSPQSSSAKLQDFVNCYRPVSTWVLSDERKCLQILANSRGVSLSAYLRTVIADVLAEETAP
jgi:hypothetical protein